MIFLIENPFNTFLQENALWIALSFASIIIVALLIIFLVGNKKTIKAPFVIKDANAFLQALGGKDNILSIAATGSRLAVSLKQKDLLDEASLKCNGVLSLIKMSDKITLVIDGSAEELLKSLMIN
ncbi:MAG: hypothetical protein WC344_03990 [Bacilli bacterium]|jgi:phosphotransferase system IIB component